MPVLAETWPGRLKRWSPADWRYREAGPRDRRLDLLRGFLVLVMVVDHFGDRSWLHTITGGNHFFVSAAEGFVLLSGLVMGLVYRRLIERDGLWVIARRGLRRAGSLYLLAVGLGVAFEFVSNRLGASWAEPVDDPAWLLGQIATIQLGAYLVDVLMLYALLVLLALPALVLLARGWRLVTIGLSFAVWTLFQLGLTGTIEPLFSGLVWFPPLAWQLIFIAGLTVGYEWQSLGRWFGRRRWSYWLPLPWLLAAGLIWLAQWAPSDWLAAPVAFFFEKEPLRLGRLLATVIFFPALLGLVTLGWQPLVRWLGWLLLPYGQHALLAYTLHLGLVLLAHCWWPLIPGYELTNEAINTLAGLLSLVLLWLLLQWVLRLHEGLLRWLGRPVGRGGSLCDRPSLAGLVRAMAPLAALLLLVGLLTPPLAPAARLAAPLTELPGGGDRSASAPDASRRAAPADHPPLVILPAPAGRIISDQLYSPALDRRLDYLILLPPGYDQSTERYPVLYLLHSLGGSHREWYDNGLLERAGWRMAEGSLPSMIVVLAEGEDGYWLNHVGAGPRWGDYLAIDVVDFVDGRLRTNAVASQRAIGGLSMGGRAALVLALTYPERFGAVGMHSPSLRSEDELATIFGTGIEFADRDPIQLLQREMRPPAALWLDTGDADPWLEQSQQLHAVLEARSIVHQWRLSQSIHAVPYWSAHVEDYLTYYGEALRRPVTTDQRSG